MSDFPNRIIDILRSCPNGLTSKDLAERLGTTQRNLSSRLSKLAAYGIIGRVRGTVAEHGTNGAIYRAPAQEGSCSANHLRTLSIETDAQANRNIAVDCAIPYESTGALKGFII